jgi:hypothetical protein
MTAPVPIVIDKNSPIIRSFLRILTQKQELLQGVFLPRANDNPRCVFVRFGPSLHNHVFVQIRGQISIISTVWAQTFRKDFQT